MKKFLCVVLVRENKTFFYKDVGMIPYSLGKFCNYKSTIAWFGNNNIIDYDEKNNFEKYCSIINLNMYKQTNDIIAVKNFLKENIRKYDIVMFYNYGSTNYKFAYYCKKYNPNIKVYCKLDMNENGFSHFYENGFVRRVKNCVERLKSKYVDIFTVETKEFYEKLKNNKMFKGRLYYLPNGVSTLDVNDIVLDKILKENIVVTVGRLGVYEKNNEMLLNVVKNIDINILKNWKIILIGPMTDNFKSYYENFLKKYEYCRKYIIYAGNITDRNELYKYYAKAKIICMTSRTESFGIATVEGMYYGAYPIITNYGQVVKDITNYNKIGKFITDNDELTLKSTLEEYMDNFAISNNNIFDECKNYARSKFNYKNIASSLDVFLNDYNS